MNGADQHLTNSGPDYVLALTKVAYDFGPFLFAILFLLVVTRSAHKYYSQVTSRSNPPPTKDETYAYRLYFLSSFLFGIILVTASVAWWIWSSTTKHVVEFVIKDVPVELTLQSDEAYTNFSRRQLLGQRYIGDWRFAVVRGAAFEPGEMFTVNYFVSDPEHGDQIIAQGQVTVRYEGQLSASYTAQYLVSGHELTIRAAR